MELGYSDATVVYQGIDEPFWDLWDGEGGYIDGVVGVTDLAEACALLGIEVPSDDDEHPFVQKPYTRAWGVRSTYVSTYVVTLGEEFTVQARTKREAIDLAYDLAEGTNMSVLSMKEIK